MVRCDLNPEQLKDERFEELCALAALGELSASEFAELNAHLPTCDNCRVLYADFRRISSSDMGAVAAGRRYRDDAVGELDESALLKGVLARAKVENSNGGGTANVRHALRPLPGPWLAWWRTLLQGPIPAALALVALCAAVGIGAYQFGSSGVRPAATPPDSQSASREAEAARLAAERQFSAEKLQQSHAELITLQKALAEARRKYAEVSQQQTVLERELAAAKEQLQSREVELQTARAGALQSDTQAKDLQAKLSDVVMRTHEQERTVRELTAKLRQAEEDATSPVTGVQDADAKELFGARDLHIVDVYDVDSSGKTRRTFGRVYFAEKKLLLFYAFDLQDKQRQRAAAGFQAWGYRQGDEKKPQNLGLFLMDDPVLSRWVLKVNNTRVLERIDAVFVTLEPPRGSPSPSGRKLLYANLGGPPNHP